MRSRSELPRQASRSECYGICLLPQAYARTFEVYIFHFELLSSYPLPQRDTPPSDGMLLGCQACFGVDAGRYKQQESQRLHIAELKVGARHLNLTLYY
jgi:hypothetical protein